MDQKEVMEGVAGAEPSLYKTDVGLFVPGTPMASTAGVEITRGPKDYAKLKKDLAAAGYNGEKIVVLAASNYPTIWAEAQVATDILTKTGFNVDLQAIDWGSVVQRRASREPIDKGGWNIFYTYLGGFGNISPAPNIAIRGNGAAAWFGWPTNDTIEELSAPGSTRRIRRRSKRSVRRCRLRSGRTRPTLRSGCTISRRHFIPICTTFQTAGRNSTD